MREAGAKFEMTAYYELYDSLTPQLFNWVALSPFIPIREIHRRRLKIFYERFQVSRNIDDDVNFLWQEMKTGAIYADVPQMLETVSQKHSVGLLSNADKDDPLIEILNESSHRFDVIITSEHVGAYKPAPMMFERMLNALNCRNTEVVMVGDSLMSDVLGAHQCDIPVVWINRTRKPWLPKYPKPDFEISNMQDLLRIL